MQITHRYNKILSNLNRLLGFTSSIVYSGDYIFSNVVLFTILLYEWVLESINQY